MRICDTCRLQDNCSQESDVVMCGQYEPEPPEVGFVREMLLLDKCQCSTCTYGPKDDNDTTSKCDICQWSTQVAQGWRVWLKRQEAQRE